MRTEMYKEKGKGRGREYITPFDSFHQEARFSNAPSPLESRISSRRDLRAAGSVKWITSQCENQSMDEPREQWENCGRVETKQGRGHQGTAELRREMEETFLNGITPLGGEVEW